MRDLLWILAFASLASASVSTADPAPRHDPVDTLAVRSAARASNRFGFELFERLRGDDGNLFFSPLSVELALGMTCEGAAGETYQQMRSTLHLAKSAGPGFLGLQEALSARDTAARIEIANALWGQTHKVFLPEFLGRLERGFGGTLRPVDFRDPSRVIAEINQWVADRTRGRIRQLLAPGSIQPTDRLVLTNAIAFKGRWSAPFPERSTQPADFKLGDRGQARVRLMTRTGELRYAEDARVQVLELPYGDGRWSMLVMLPRHAGDLVALEKDFTDPVVSRWIARLAPRSVEVYLPRFRLEAHYDLEQVLPALGMPDAFDARRADFSRMDGLRDLFIGLVTHKAFVDVTEEGTEAAASTAVGMRTTSVAPEPPVLFRADHPFLFVIRDGQSGAVVFLGRLSKPG